MQTVARKSVAEGPPSKPPTAKAPDIASVPVPDTLEALYVNPDTGLTHAEVDVRRKEHGYNEVAEKTAKKEEDENINDCFNGFVCF